MCKPSGLIKIPLNLHILIRIGTATVWFVFGFIFKVLDLVPRHRMIVASILGEEVAGPVTLLIGLSETGIAVWILCGLRPRTCATVQTIALVSMNILELLLARPLLLAPLPMVCFNIAFLCIVWYVALRHSGKAVEADSRGMQE